jgi:inosine-uridine nucleoside N-ribohydrolase
MRGPWWLVGAAALLVLATQAPPASAEPVRLVFDTDIGADIDDALALGVIHALQARGECRLLAVTLTNAHPDSALVVDAIDTFYGHAGTPIGVATNNKPAHNPYLGIAHLRDGDGLRYPRAVQSSKDLPGAPTLLRRVLAAQPDGSVVIAQVGFSSNLAALLASGPDDLSPLGGKDLARRKVRLLSVMGGAFVPIDKNPRYPEYNIKSDIPAAQRLAAEWPTPIVWSGFEIGIDLPYPAGSIEHDFGYVAHHPLTEAYRRFGKMPFDRPTWDLTAVLYAIRPECGYFDLSPPGRVVVEADGVTRFDRSADGPHRYLILRPGQRGRTLEALVQLTSQPPSVPPGRGAK